MADAKIDVLLMQNNNDHMGGYVRYFTDMPATNGYPNTVVFPRDDEMRLITEGEHLHSTEPQHRETFEQFCYRLGVNEAAEHVNWE